MTNLDARSGTDRRWMADALLRRAAMHFERCNRWRDAAQCWIELREPARAGALLAQLGDHGRRGDLLLENGLLSEALQAYETWLGVLPASDVVGHVSARLGIAAALTLLDRELDRAQTLYREARALIEHQETIELVAAARCWEALGEHGVRVGRSDLRDIGHERALVCYGDAHNADRVRVAKRYRDAALGGNRLLVAEIEGRLATWLAGAPTRVVRDAARPVDVAHLAVGEGACWGASWLVWRMAWKGLLFVNPPGDLAVEVWTDSPGWFRYSKGKLGYVAYSDGTVSANSSVIASFRRYLSQRPTLPLGTGPGTIEQYVLEFPRDALVLRHRVTHGAIRLQQSAARFTFAPGGGRPTLSVE